MRIERKKRSVAAILLLTLLLTACQESDTGSSRSADASRDEGRIHIVLTNRDTEDQLFTIDDSVCMLAEGRLYLYNLQSLYQQIYGADIWQRRVSDKTLEDELKEMALSRLVRIKTMALLAADRGIEPTEEDLGQIREAADRYYNALSETQVAEIGLGKDQIENCYRELFLADKVYQQIITETEPEISDDEARCVTVSQILLKTVETDHTGSEKKLDQNGKKEVYQKALSILARLNQGEDFDQMAAVNNQADKITISFGKGEVEESLEEAAFALGEGQLSRIVETDQGYVILKCIQSFDREQTDLRKEQIAAMRKEEAFSRIYEDFSKGKVRRLYEDKWKKIPLSNRVVDASGNFFSIYEAIQEAE